MRQLRFGPTFVAAILLALAPGVRAQTKKQIEDQKLELLRGLGSEFATAQTYFPRSKTPLGFEADTGYWNEEGWKQLGAQTGPAARKGDLVQITKVTVEGSMIVLELDYGFSGRNGHWYDGVSVNGGPPINGTAAPAPGGTVISVHYPNGLNGVTSERVKTDLTPILNFDQRSASETYTAKLPPEVRGAIQDKKVIVGMTRDEVLLAMGQPAHKSRENVDGVDLEYWVYGTPPGKVTFVTLKGQKVTKVFEDYAVPGGTIATNPQVPQ